jgi:hypothetical protein
MVMNLSLAERAASRRPLVLYDGDSRYDVTTNSRVVELPTGLLSLKVTRSDLDVDHLLDIAARRNPKRGFSFMSRVICRQYPTRPRDARRVQNIVAGRIPGDLPGPVVCIAMAEMAITFGQGVHESYVRRTGRDDVLFLHSTRFRLDKPVAVEFREEHSHASDHIMYMPDGEREQELLRTARSLVLLDDEVTTGKTFVNLARAFRGISDRIENIVTGVIADWRGDEVTALNARDLGPNYLSINVLEGNYEFQPHPALSSIVMPKVTGNGAPKDEVMIGQFGRLGLTSPIEIDSGIARRLGVRRNQRVLVLGTGEHSYVPFLIAEQLEREGCEAYCQATSRSPLMEHGPVRYMRTYRDNYGDGIENYLYNVDAGDYDRVIICTETHAHMLDPDLVSDLNAQVLGGI